MQSIMTRDQQNPQDTWDLSSLYDSDAAWETDLERLATYPDRLDEYPGTLDQSADHLQEYLDLTVEVGILEEQLGYYAMLRQSEDAGNSAHQDRFSRYVQV
ncbi:MAG: oligoendopeptidase F, partial [Spirochaeta sp.]|nr:oligoendopeptidase F [Spirochaeta sp.]